MAYKKPITFISVNQRGMTAHVKFQVNGKAAGTLLVTKQEAAAIIDLLTAKPELVPVVVAEPVAKPKAKPKPRRKKQTTTIKKVEPETADLGIQFRPVAQD